METMKVASCFSTPSVMSTYRDIFTTDSFNKWIKDHAKEVKDILDKVEEQQKATELKVAQTKNRYYRSLVKHIKFSGDACVIYWNDGTQTVSRWDHIESFDPEKAILAAMAKKLYGGTNIYCEVLKKYAEDGWHHWEQSGDELDYIDCKW